MHRQNDKTRSEVENPAKRNDSEEVSKRLDVLEATLAECGRHLRELKEDVKQIKGKFKCNPRCQFQNLASDINFCISN